MNEILDGTSNGGSFSLQKIPFDNQQEEKTDIDKVKILELNNIVDKWEKEVLFGENGFFSFKGKEVQNKTNEFINELTDFIGRKIQECSFSSQTSKRVAVQIKNEKISAILNKMKAYELQELSEWANTVYEDTLNSCINRAVLYKNDDEIIQKSFINAISVLNIMKDKENWNDKTFRSKRDKFRSDFYYAIIKAFMAEKDINAYKYFSTFKKDLLIDDKEDLEKSLEQLKINVIAYNWAKELYSYNLSDDEQAKYINDINDSEIEKCVKNYLNEFSKTDKKQKENRQKIEKEENWKNIISAFEENPDNTFVYIDYTLPQDHINAVKKYINQMKKDGCIKTDKEEFIKLLKEFFDDFNKFVQKDISSYRACLSAEDFEIFANFREYAQKDFEIINSDFEYALKLLKKLNIDKAEDKYNFAKLYLKELEEYKENNDKIPDLHVRNNLINTVSSRFIKEKEEGKES